MRLADLSVQKLANTSYKCSCGKVHTSDCDMFFCENKRIKEILDERLRDYKTLFVTDFTDGTKVASLFGDRVSIVVQGNNDDVTQLFAFSDNINFVVAYGGKRVIENARYFSSVRKIRCAVLCRESDAESIISENVTVFVNRERYSLGAKTPEFLFFNEGNIRAESAKDTYIKLIGAALSLFEIRFKELVLSKEIACREVYELAYDVFLSMMNIKKSYSPSASLFEQSFRWNYCVKEGLPATECGYFMDCFPNEEKLFAYKKMTELYYIFFSYGKCRRYAAADYFSRVRNAALFKGVSEFDVSEKCYIPTVEEIERFGVKFEETKERFALRAKELMSRELKIFETYSFFGGVTKESDAGNRIYYLPEISGEYGVVSLMRDFGLLDRRKKFG